MPWYQPTLQPGERRAAQHAKVLRRTLTEPEKRLWWNLRHRLAIEGTHFRRQVAIGAYVADFCCLGHRLIIEVDGGQHTFDDAAAYDAQRTAYLQSQGFRVFRFTNREVMVEIDSVLDTVFAALSPSTPTPDPSPRGGGEEELFIHA